MKTALTDDELIERFQHAAFNYFLEFCNPENGLVADTSRPGSPASIAVVGFALSCYPVGVERGWMTRAEALQRTLATLRFFHGSPQGTKPDATGNHGFFYHFLDMQTGQRAWKCEVSVIDTTLLLAGVLTASGYFDGDEDGEAEVRRLADAIYRRIDWDWARGGKNTVRQGWKPKSGFIKYGWDGYDEALILYVLGMASPSHPLPPEMYLGWTKSYEWKKIYDIDYLYAGPMFIHHYSHAWIDLSGIRDEFMRGKDCDYFENTSRAAHVQSEYARHNPHGFRGYDRECWGFTACDGPGSRSLKVDGRVRRFRGYVARGAPYGPDDGTIDPCTTLASLPFAPELVLSAMRHFSSQYPDLIVDFRLPSAFNPTLSGKGPSGWVSEGFYGLDQGIVVLMIENYRSGLIWKLMRKSPYLIKGLGAAGFDGGWLSERNG